MGQKRRIIPLILVAVHSAWVLLIAMWIGMNYAGPGYQQELQLWILVAIFDLPATFIMEVLPGMWGRSTLSNVVYPAAIYLTLGGVQWWLIGMGMAWVGSHIARWSQRIG